MKDKWDKVSAYGTFLLFNRGIVGINHYFAYANQEKKTSQAKIRQHLEF